MKRLQSEKNPVKRPFARHTSVGSAEIDRAHDRRGQAHTIFAPARAWLGSFKGRVIVGLALLVCLFLLYRFIWMAGWYWPYSLICDYLKARLPMVAPWAIETVALLACALLLAQAGAILSFIFFGRQKRAMAVLIIIGALAHGTLGWYSYGRVVVDQHGRVQIRVVESRDGTLKVVDGDFDPETGKRARPATDNDIVMLALQRRGEKVRQAGANGPFRSTQGRINVYYTLRGDRIALYTGPRHPDVGGDMPLATEEILRQFLSQERQK